MRRIFLSSSRNVWTEEDLAAAMAHLGSAFPGGLPKLNQAIVHLASQQLKPSCGRAKLLDLVTRYARDCPRTIGMEAALYS